MRKIINLLPFKQISKYEKSDTTYRLYDEHSTQIKIVTNENDVIAKVTNSVSNIKIILNTQFDKKKYKMLEKLLNVLPQCDYDLNVYLIAMRLSGIDCEEV